MRVQLWPPGACEESFKPELQRQSHGASVRLQNCCTNGMTQHGACILCCIRSTVAPGAVRLRGDEIKACMHAGTQKGIALLYTTGSCHCSRSSMHAHAHHQSKRGAAGRPGSQRAPCPLPLGTMSSTPRSTESGANTAAADACVESTVRASAAAHHHAAAQLMGLVYTAAGRSTRHTAATERAAMPSPNQPLRQSARAPCVSTRPCHRLLARWRVWRGTAGGSKHRDTGHARAASAARVLAACASHVCKCGPSASDVPPAHPLPAARCRCQFNRRHTKCFQQQPTWPQLKRPRQLT